MSTTSIIQDFWKTLAIFLVSSWITIIIARYSYQHYLRLRAARSQGCKAPRFLPQWDPILGLDVALQMYTTYGSGNRSEKFKEQHATYGHTFQSMAMRKTRIFTIDTLNLQSIFNTNFHSWGVQPLRLPAWAPMLGAGVMDTDGSHWKFSRDMVQPLFRRDQISDLSNFAVYVDQLLELIPRDGSTVDMQPLFSRLILDFTMEFLFGASSQTLTPTPDKEAIEFLHAFHYAQGCIGKRTQLPYPTLFTSDKKFKLSCEIARKFVEKNIDRARLRLSQPKFEENAKYILAEEFIKQEIDNDEVTSQLLNVFLAAHDTTSVLLTNTFFNLARHPQYYQKLREEILQSKNVPTKIDTLKSFKYLQKVVTETSRLTPVVGQSARIALQDTTLPKGGGEFGDSPIFVRKGTSVQFNFFTLHRRSDVYEDPESFLPDRWDDLKVGTWDFLPFGGGPRVCPANQMALMQVCYTVARIIQVCSNIENRDPILEFMEQYHISTESKNGCKVAFGSEK